MPMTRNLVVPAEANTWTIAIHGGAGGRIVELSEEREQAFRDGLTEAYDAGAAVLEAGGSALDAVVASVAVLEDNPLFNAGRGAALTMDGRVEHDACVMTGDGRTGAVAGSRHTRHPIALAQHVRDHSPHVLLVDPPAQMSQAAGLETVDSSWFVTDARRAQLERILAEEEAPLKHGTVGAVARDVTGAVAAATSTGGISKQWPGRVGDTPIVGAGTWADPGLAISCTGDGEAFIAGVVAHDIAARVRYGAASVDAAVEATFAAELDTRDATGGLVAVTGEGAACIAHSSPMMFAAYRDAAGELVVLV